MTIIVDDTFYWYGSHREKSADGGECYSVRFYASRDLYNWEYKGDMIYPKEPEWVAGCCCTRIIYNKRTRKYVAWFTYLDDYHQEPAYSNALGVMTADSLMGPYKLVNLGIHPMGMCTGSWEYAVDPQDGKGYMYFDRSHSEMICADLTDDYTNVTGYYSTHFPRVAPPYVREAPAYFYRRGKHYMLTSGTTAWFPNPSEIAVADTYHGPWTVLGDPHRNDPSRTSFNSQIFGVLRHPGKKDLYIALADRHLPRLPELYPKEFHNGRLYERAADWLITGKTDLPLDELFDNVVCETEYVWLPVRFDGDIPYIEWLDEWRVEDFE